MTWTTMPSQLRPKALLNLLEDSHYEAQLSKSAAGNAYANSEIGISLSAYSIPHRDRYIG